ncbi:MAG: hypothetical protein ABR921_15240 [Candidatus Sulfotelmatobacter sp.]|jgi:hypothetical protein
MKALCKIVVVAAAFFAVPLSLSLPSLAAQQEAKPAPKPSDAPASKPSPSPAPSVKASNDGKQYSGMYTFLKEGEYLQITVEDAGQVAGFISRYDDGGSEKGEFIDQFFKTGKLDDNKLSFTTKPSNDVWFEFNGSAQRGEGQNPGDDAYYVLKGTLTENTTGPDKKVSSRPRDVTFKMFPQEAESPPAAKN